MKYISFIIVLSVYLFGVDYGTARNQILFNEMTQNINKSTIQLTQEIERDIYLQLKKISSYQKELANISSLKLNISKLDVTKLDKNKKEQLLFMLRDLNSREDKLNLAIKNSKDIIKSREELKIKLISQKGE